MNIKSTGEGGGCYRDLFQGVIHVNFGKKNEASIMKSKFSINLKSKARCFRKLNEELCGIEMAESIFFQCFMVISVDQRDPSTFLIEFEDCQYNQ